MCGSADGSSGHSASGPGVTRIRSENESEMEVALVALGGEPLSVSM